MPSLKYYDPASLSYKYLVGGLSQESADARYAQKNIFDSAAHRDSVLGPVASVSEGTMCYLKDTGTVQMHNGFVWVGDTAWTSLILLNGWVASTPAPKIRMDCTGRVNIDGGRTVGTSATSLTFCNLPTKFRPTATVYTPVGANSGIVAGASAYMSIAATGDLALGGVTAANAVSTLYIQVDYLVPFLAVR